jgi:hypothetical protein
VKLVELTLTGPEPSVAAALSVCEPEASIRRSVNAATPFAAATVAVPWSVPAPVWIVIVTLVVESPPVVTTLPYGSSTLTTGCVPNAEPAVAPAGWAVKTSVEADAGLTVNEVLSPSVRPLATVALNVKLVAWSISSPLPVIVPLPEPVPML